MCQRKLWCIGKSYDADAIAETLEPMDRADGRDSRNTL